MRKTIIGTEYFVSRMAAIQYYRAYHYTEDDVDRKLRDGEIHIGKPDAYVKFPHKVVLIDDWLRYGIEVDGA